MNISEAARRAGLPAKTIRYYEDIGLVAPQRDPNGYRAFQPRDLQALGLSGPGECSAGAGVRLSPRQRPGGTCAKVDPEPHGVGARCPCPVSQSAAKHA